MIRNEVKERINKRLENLYKTGKWDEMFESYEAIRIENIILDEKTKCFLCGKKCATESLNTLYYITVRVKGTKWTSKNNNIIVCPKCYKEV